jgi:hypothetical protein
MVLSRRLTTAACLFALVCPLASAAGAERVWRNPVTDGTATISIDWMSWIDSLSEGVLFTFHHSARDAEVALIVESAEVASPTEYLRRLPNVKGFGWGSPLWELMREESGRDVYYAAYSVEGDGNGWSPSYVEIRVWRDSKGVFWTSGIRCASDDAQLVAEARKLVRVLEGTVLNPHKPAEDQTPEIEPT